MLPLSAADAISHAIARTHTLLLRPFRWTTSWKLAGVSYLSLCGSFFIPYPLLLWALPPSSFPVPAHARMVLIGLLWASFAVYVLIFYACARMEFVAFEMTVTLERRLKPMWRRYRTRVWSWLGLKLAFASLVSLLLARPATAVFRALVDTLPPPGSPPVAADFERNMHVLLGFYAVGIAWFALLKLFDTLLHDFVLPVYVLEPVSLGQALARGGRLLAGNAGASTLYLLLKACLGVAAYFALNVASLLSFIPIAIVAFAAGALGGALAHAVHGPVGTLLASVTFFLAGVSMLALMLYVQLGLTGYLVNLFDAYAVVFVGSRYPALGKMLEPGASHPFTPPPPVVPPGDDGPSLPMNPALA